MITNILRRTTRTISKITINYIRPHRLTPLGLILPSHCFTTNKISEQQLQELKQKGKQFYSNQVSDVIQLASMQDFNTIVTSIQVPFLANFYADWNLACKTMTPRLQQKIHKSQGKVKLLNINIDKFGPIVNVFQVKSVPTVFLVYKGKVIDAFNGELSEEMLDKFLQTIQRITKFDKSQQQSLQVLEKAQAAIRQTDYETAQKLLVSMKTLNVKEELVFVKNIFLAFIYGELGKVSHLKALMEIMSKNQEFYTTKQQFKELYFNLIERCKENQKAKEENNEMQDWKNKLEQQPNNLQLKFQAAKFYQQNQLIEEALIQLLAIVKANKSWQDKKANKAILQIFKKLGNTSPLTQTYRKLLQRALN